ncbi:protein PAL OF QUIRKY-like [Bidens hawaiensis]|uniref:protein PAL OF QUIRKY-like n=1 Tax=Bidens hawaiensis TaxID=980011 RepID=UPI00404B3AB5
MDSPHHRTTTFRLMVSTGGHILPRPHDKSLRYVGGETRMLTLDRHTTLSDLTTRLSKTIIKKSCTSSSTSSSVQFALKYQLPNEELDSLISVTTDEDMENMIDECERLSSGTSVNRKIGFSTR